LQSCFILAILALLADPALVQLVGRDQLSASVRMTEALALGAEFVSLLFTGYPLFRDFNHDLPDWALSHHHTPLSVVICSLLLITI
jgi:hypothetical protein